MGPFISLGAFEDYLQTGRTVSGTPQAGITRTVALEAEVRTTQDCNNDGGCRGSHQACIGGMYVVL
jgi:hypothetical protein